MNQTLRSSLLIGLLAATTSLVGCGTESTSTGTPGTSGAAGAAAGSGGAGNGGSSSGSGGSTAGSGGSTAGSGGSDAGSGGSDAGSGGSDAGSGGSDAGSGGSDAGSGGSDAGSGGSDAGSGGSDAGSGGSDAGSGGSDAGSGGSDAGSGGSDAGAGGSDAGSGGSDAGAGGSDAGSGGSDAGSGGAAAGSGGSDAGAGGSSAGSGGSSAGAGGSSAGAGGSSAGSGGSGGSGGAPLTCADAYSESKCGQCGEKSCCPEMEACLKDANCLACLQGDDAKCTGSVLDKLNTCLDTKCKDECSGTCNDGGGEYGSGDFACESCQDKELATGGCCAAEAAKCNSNKACTDLNTCLGKCTTQACVDQCTKQFPNGVNDLNAVLDCTFGDGTTTAGACGIACGGKAATCTDGGKEYGSGAAACDKCQDTEMADKGCCVYEAAACSNNKACVDLNTCLGTCTTQACVDQCAAKFPNGIGHYNDLISCLYGPDNQSVGACGTVCQ